MTSYRRDLLNALEDCHTAVCIGYPEWLKALDKLAEARKREPTPSVTCRLTRKVDEYLKKASNTP